MSDTATAVHAFGVFFAIEAHPIFIKLQTDPNQGVEEIGWGDAVFGQSATTTAGETAMRNYTAGKSKFNKRRDTTPRQAARRKKPCGFRLFAYVGATAISQRYVRARECASDGEFKQNAANGGANSTPERE